MAPREAEYLYLTKQLKSLGYKQTTGSGWMRQGEDFRFDIFNGNRIHPTELQDSPLDEGRHSALMEFSHLYIGILNDYDLIASKLMRGTRVDFDDCVSLAEAHRATLDIQQLIRHFIDLVRYDVAEHRLRPNIDHFLDLLKERGLYG